MGERKLEGSRMVFRRCITIFPGVGTIKRSPFSRENDQRGSSSASKMKTFIGLSDSNNKQAI